jgi:pantetheine-phosphate adenylyltransferase
VTTALYAGSFDPIHLGHLAVIEQSARSFDHVVVAVLANPQKPSGLLTAPERVVLVEASTTHLPNVRCVHFFGLTVDLARREGADVLVRSAHKDVNDERSMAAMNEMLSGIRTFFAAPAPATAAVSSSMVRRLIAAGRVDLATHLVPPAVADALSAKAQIDT